MCDSPGSLAAKAGALFTELWAGNRSRPLGSARAFGDVLVPNHSRICQHQVRRLYLRFPRGARSRLFLTTPWFVPDVRLQSELMNAAGRGVDVRLLLPGRSDVPIPQWAAQAAYSQLLSSSIRIFEYQSRMLHAKTGVGDGRVATVGTANLDYRSLFFNYELNLFSASRTPSAALEPQFDLDLAESPEVTPRHWSRRPSMRQASEAVGWVARAGCERQVRRSRGRRSWGVGPNESLPDGGERGPRSRPRGEWWRLESASLTFRCTCRST